MDHPHSQFTPLALPQHLNRTAPLKSSASRSKYGMVATAHRLATDAGVWALKEGGNAVDAAVASALALSVCEPAASGLGGQTMMLIHLDANKRTIALDGSSRAPLMSHANRFASEQCRFDGYKAATVPSTPYVLAYTARHYGRLPFEALLEPAIRIAVEGFEITPLLSSLVNQYKHRIQDNALGHMFLDSNNRCRPAGTTITNPPLAWTLKRMQKHGVADFYSGKIARMIVEDMKDNLGLIQAEDLKLVKPPLESSPVMACFGNDVLSSMPAPGAGPSLIESFAMVETLEAAGLKLDSAAGFVAFAGVIRDTLARRYGFASADIPILSVERAKRAAASRGFERIKSSGDTTHLSVMDDEGNAVALTQSVERVFGSGIMNPELGFVYNNYMSAFDTKDKNHPFYLRPMAKPWSTVAPSIIFRNGAPRLVIGSPGSDRILSAVLQVLLRLKRQDAYEAVAAPRLHSSPEGVVSMEAARFDPETIRSLKRTGFQIDPQDPYSFLLGCVQLVMKDGKTFIGVADPRRDGTAAGH